MARNILSVTARALRRYAPTFPLEYMCRTANKSEFLMTPNAHNVPARGTNVTLCKTPNDNVDDISNDAALLDAL